MLFAAAAAAQALAGDLQLHVQTKLEDRRLGPLRASALGAALADTVVPETASARIDAMAGNTGAYALVDLRRRLETATPPVGVRLEIEQAGLSLLVTARGPNALVALAQVLEPELPPGGARDLLMFAKIAGKDLPAAAVIPTRIRAMPGDKYRLTIDIRGVPGMGDEEIRARLAAETRKFNERHGSALEPWIEPLKP